MIAGVPVQYGRKYLGTGIDAIGVDAVSFFVCTPLYLSLSLSRLLGMELLTFLSTMVYD